MSQDFALPYSDELGFCNIKMSSVGGDGANMAGKMLFKIAVEYMGLDGAFDAKYGSEKKGTPTDVSVKLCERDKSIRQTGPTDSPHVLVIFREDLIGPLSLIQGVQENAIVIVNTERTPDEIRDELKLHSGTIICVDALDIASKTRSRLNMPLLSALVYALGLPEEIFEKTIKTTWPKPEVQKANIDAFEQTLGSKQEKKFEADGKYELVPGRWTYETPVGWKNQNKGGWMEARHFSLHPKDMKITRQGLIPVFDAEACIHCAKCFYTCADPGSIIFEDSKMVGYNYAHCKGCLRCVAVCPTHKKGKALSRAQESENHQLVADRTWF
ncbi:2-oxoacid:acceptor oxidoreductase family protein [Desulfurispira natronophila]|uniref:Pyruvate ferredoxin oxidoreductase gamma subunit n=1 Tax=Desulfurispira natronophila TaxID=682562 RepID=A0A7W8DH98_9BACT|nr:2-oxoacid:acceptor oxidoreductase family protein [Desulfurispira natronophila]MBB5022275.1 pyruvate ferredoxin oxidoreductase gamma subunit [Desulfurispira natronophila]